MSLDEIKKECKIPVFVESNESDIWLNTNIKSLLSNVFLLAVDKVLSETELFKIVDECNSATTFIFDYLDNNSDDRIILVTECIINFNESLEEKLLESEFYEALQNFTEFKKFYYIL